MVCGRAKCIKGEQSNEYIYQTSTEGKEITPPTFVVRVVVQ